MAPPELELLAPPEDDPPEDAPPPLLPDEAPLDPPGVPLLDPLVVPEPELPLPPPEPPLVVPAPPSSPFPPPGFVPFDPLEPHAATTPPAIAADATAATQPTSQGTDRFMSASR